ncbi:MAG: ATP-grasp domain-containing protein [Schaedlerella sp.]|nr:ATP-grasp domain-containing protein [Schaedlerella sp.]
MDLSGYIIEKYNNMANAYTCHRLVSEAKELGIDLKLIGVHDTMVCEDGMYNNGEKLEKRDFVINRYKWGKIKRGINDLTERSYNPLEIYEIFINKYEQIRRLRSEEFLIPRSVLATSQIKYEQIKSYLGSPFVAKGLENSMGNEIILIKEPEDFKQLKEKYEQEKEWLFQEFITTSIGRDMRFYSVRGEAVACMMRKSQGDFRANVALGASVEPYEITPQIQKIAKDIYEQTKLDFLGIDLMFGKEKPYFCEINVMPGLEGIEMASGKNVAKMIMETIKKDFKYE